MCFFDTTHIIYDAVRLIDTNIDCLLTDRNPFGEIFLNLDNAPTIAILSARHSDSFFLSASIRTNLSALNLNC